MSQVTIELFTLMAEARSGVPNLTPAHATQVETLSSSASSQPFSITASEGGQAVSIANDGTDSIRVAIGANPVAASGQGHVVMAGERRAIGGLHKGDRIAIINA